MKIIKILNLYAGIGGNRAKWENCQVTNVERNGELCQLLNKLYRKDTTIQADSLEYLLHHWHEYDFIWASPPCQAHSKAAICNNEPHLLRDREGAFHLFECIIFMSRFCGDKKWLVENVKPYYPFMMQGAKQIDRHFFWANFPIGMYRGKEIAVKNATLEEMQEYLGLSIDLEKPIYLPNQMGNYSKEPAQIFRNAVHPDLGLHILRAATAQTALF